MALIAYKGKAGIRELAAADLQKAGVEDSGFTKTSFPRHIFVEVPDAAAAAILERGDLFGKFEAPKKSEAAPANPSDADNAAAKKK